MNYSDHIETAQEARIVLNHCGWHPWGGHVKGVELWERGGRCIFLHFRGNKPGEEKLDRVIYGIFLRDSPSSEVRVEAL